MRNTIQRHAILLAALLQVLPIVRNFFANPAATSSFAFILRWGVGTAATVGAYDAYSASSIPVFVSPTNFYGNVGTYFTNNVVITNVGTDPGAYFNMINSNFTVYATHVSNNIVTTSCLPAGLSFRCIDGYAKNPPIIIGSIYGTPTTPVTNLFIHFQAGHPAFGASATLDTTNYFTIFPAVSSFAPSITTQPVSLTNNVGGNPAFSVTGGGTAPLFYHWYYNTNTALPYATNASVTVTNVQLTNAGYYRVIITNSSGSITSSSALLTVWQPPNITNQPVNFTNVAGGGASFMVVAGSVPALSYQWKYNTNITVTGATSSTYSLSNIRASQTGYYSVVITNSAGSITSSPAALVVTNPLVPPVSSTITAGGGFNFTFTPVPGLTNTILTNGSLVGGNWGVWTNLPPPANNNPVTISNTFNLPNLFYRLMVSP